MLPETKLPSDYLLVCRHPYLVDGEVGVNPSPIVWHIFEEFQLVTFNFQPFSQDAFSAASPPAALCHLVAMQSQKAEDTRFIQYLIVPEQQQIPLLHNSWCELAPAERYSFLQLEPHGASRVSKTAVMLMWDLMRQNCLSKPQSPAEPVAVRHYQPLSEVRACFPGPANT